MYFKEHNICSQSLLPLNIQLIQIVVVCNKIFFFFFFFLIISLMFLLESMFMERRPRKINLYNSELKIE